MENRLGCGDGMKGSPKRRRSNSSLDREYVKGLIPLSLVHNITLAQALRREPCELKIIFDKLIGWTLE